MILDAKFAALSDPTRRAILARLVNGQTCAGDLAAPFDISQPAVSRHLRVLQEAGMIQREVRGTQRLYSLSPNALDGIEDVLSPLKGAVIANDDRLDDVLAGLFHRKT